MKTLIYYLAFLLNIFTNPIHCDNELKSTLDSVQDLESGKELLANVTRDGPITIKTEKDFPFEAYWDPSNRTIAISTTQNRAYSLIFELQNAASQKEFDQLDSLAIKGNISRSDYILKVETIEYQNTRKTSAIMDEGIHLGLFSPQNKTFYHPNFEEHFQDQVKKGHSGYIGQSYDNLISS